MPISKIDDEYDVGCFWLIDKGNDVIWHNGEVAMGDFKGKEAGYQSFVEISPKENKVVVILSNVIANDEDGTAYSDMLGYSLMTE